MFVFLKNAVFKLKICVAAIGFITGSDAFVLESSAVYHGSKDALALPAAPGRGCGPLKATSGHRLYQPICWSSRENNWHSSSKKVP